MTGLQTQLTTHKKDKIYEGLKKTAEIVASTLGAEGKFVGITTNDGGLRFTKDGVSVAKSISLADPLSNIGAQMVINSASKTVGEVGDGTTTTSVLLLEMASYYEAHKEDFKGNINEFVAEFEKAIEVVIANLEEGSKKVETNEQIRDIARVSANSNRLGDMIAEIYEKVGIDSLVELNPEVSEVSTSTYYDITEGLEMRNGMVNPRFSNLPNGNCMFEDPYIYLTESKVTDEDKFLDQMEKAHNDKTPLVIIAPAFSDSFVKLCLFNKINAQVKICLIKAPGYGKGQIESLKDIKAFCDSDGFVDKILVTPTHFTLFNEDHPLLERRVAELQQLRDSSEDLYDIEDYDRRIHKLKSSLALIFAGGVTEKNAKEEYDRIEDALGAVKSALRGGFSLGGGYALYNCKDSYTGSNSKVKELIRSICHAPMLQILENGFVNYKEVLNTLDDNQFNIRTKQYEKFSETGIIDPTDVIVQSLRNSLASFKLYIKTKYVIVNSSTMLR